MPRILVALVLGAGAITAPAQSPDLIVIASHVWTGDSTRPRATAIAVRGERIVAVGSRDEVLPLRGQGTRVMELGERFIAPGFIDNHTHFERAGALITGVNLLDVSDSGALVRRVREARDRLPAGAWLIGGEWGAYEEWAMGSTGANAANRTVFAPHRSVIDSITQATPAILNKWDRSAYLANGRAIELAKVDCSWEGVECERGQPTGRMNGAAAARVIRVIPSKPFEQRLIESRSGLHHLNALGVTSIHDITGAEQLAVYQELRRRGELTLRV